MPEEEKKETSTEDKLDKILGVLTALDKRITKVEEEKVVKEDVVKYPEESEPKPSAELDSLFNRVPSEFIELKNQILGEEFGISLVPVPNSAAFQLNISVPREFSNMSKDEWDIKKVDLRSRIITQSEGIPFVKEWFGKIATNLKIGQDMPVAFSINKAPTQDASGLYPTPEPPKIN